MLEETKRNQSHSQEHEDRDIDEHIVVLHKESLCVFEEDSLKPHCFGVKDPYARDDKSENEDNNQQSDFESFVRLEETASRHEYFECSMQAKRPMMISVPAASTGAATGRIFGTNCESINHIPPKPSDKRIVQASAVLKVR